MGVIFLLIGVSIVIAILFLSLFLWASKNGQFDDEEKFLNGAKFDNEDDLNDAANLERKKEKLKKNYRPE